MRERSGANIEALLTDRTTIIFDAAAAQGNELTVPLEGATLRFVRGDDGSWRLDGSGPALELVASGAVGGLSDVVLVGDGKVCHSTCALDSLLASRCAWGEPTTEGDTKSVCYPKPAFTAGPNKLAASFAFDGAEVYWIPVTAAGALDSAREGAIVWRYFDLYHPNGSGQVARLRIGSR